MSWRRSALCRVAEIVMACSWSEYVIGDNLSRFRWIPLDAHPQGMNGGVEQAFASALRGLAVAGMLFDVGNQAGIENALPIVRGIKTTIEVQVGSTEIDTHLFGHL